MASSGLVDVVIAVNYLHGLFLEYPSKQVVYVLEMVVKRLAVHAAVGDYLRNRYL